MVQQNLIKQEIINQVILEYEAKVDSEMGKLFNRFVGYISEARIPLSNALVVIEMLREATVKQAYEKYLGD